MATNDETLHLAWRTSIVSRLHALETDFERLHAQLDALRDSIKGLLEP